MTNRLAEASSPYLRQHAENPVDWWPWCQEAFDTARARDVPVLVSIGYSTCHWCHVMAAESFSDPDTAAQLNAEYVAIKVDREELPTVDSYYMDALQAMRGAGGWPLTVVTDHDGRPFFTGTYFPREPRPGQPAFRQVLTAVTATWRSERERVSGIAAHLTEALAAVHEKVAASLPAGTAAEVPAGEELTAAVEMLESAFDARTGGFGRAPKFPPLMTLIHLITHVSRVGLGEASTASGAAGQAGTTASGTAAASAASTGARALRMIRTTMAHIAAGGMRDQVAGGIARYSVDAAWCVPHFEKMLYDNALYLRAATAWHRLERWLAAGSGQAAPGPQGTAARCAALAEREARETIAHLRSTLTTAGTFAAALDADSPDESGRSVEGAYYTLSPRTGAEVLGAGSMFALAGDVEGARVLTAPGILDWLGGTAGAAGAPGTAGAAGAPGSAGTGDAPWLSEQTAAERAALAQIRATRVFPHVDDKTVTEWNALAVTAFAEASLVFADESLAVTAREVFAALLAGTDLAAGDLPRSRGTGTSGTEPADTSGTEPAGTSGTEPADTSGTGLGTVPGPGRAGLADWAGVARAALALHALGDERSRDRTTGYLEMAITAAGRIVADFIDADSDPMHCIDGADPIIGITTSDPIDSTTPSGRSAAAEVFLLLAEHTLPALGWGEPGPGGREDAGGFGSPGSSGGSGGFTGSGSSGGSGGGDAAQPGTGFMATEYVYGLLSAYRPLIQEAPRGCGWALHLSELIASKLIHVTTAQRRLAEIAAGFPLVAIAEIAAEGPGGSVPDAGATVCRDSVCLPPLADAEALITQLEALAPPRG